jgi:hypothetical protein
VGKQGAVRRIHLAPPAADPLAAGSKRGTGSSARVAALFANGTFGVWELDQQMELKQVRRLFPVNSHLSGFSRLTWVGVLE